MTVLCSPTATTPHALLATTASKLFPCGFGFIQCHEGAFGVAVLAEGEATAGVVGAGLSDDFAQPQTKNALPQISDGRRIESFARGYAPEP
jgi:hypothetical protein